MGYKHDGWSLSTEWAADLSAASEWATTSTVSAILKPLRENGWLSRATDFWFDEEDDAPIPPDVVLDELVQGWRETIAEFYLGDRRDASWKVRIAMERTGMYVTVAFAREHITPSLPDELGRLVAAWTEAFAPTPLQLAIGAVMPFGIDYDKPIPHRESRWQLGAIDHYLGRAWHLSDAETAPVLQAVEEAPLPEGIVRTIEGDVTRVGSSGEPTDRAAIASARARVERWFAPLVRTRLAPGWNEQGDRLAVIFDRDDQAPFTFYDTRNGVAYKAITVDPSTGQVDEPLWRELAAIAATKQAPDGTAVQAVRLIVPTRGDALRVLERARADGIERVAYPEDDAFWCIDPAPRS